MSKKVAQVAIQQILNKMGEGELPPWRKNFVPVGWPQNFAGRKYTGSNTLFLSTACSVYGWEHPVFITAKELKKRNARYNEGAESVPVIYCGTADKKDKKTGEKTGEKYTFMRYSRVYNIKETTGLNWEPPPPRNPGESIAECERVIQGYNGPEIQEDQVKRNFYLVSSDSIHMVPRDRWDCMEAFYSVAFHEMAHSTGHPNRNNRYKITHSIPFFGSEDYSREELIAELTNYMLCLHTGISNHSADLLTNSTAYVKSWLKKFKDDPRELIRASADAQRAFNRIVGAT